MVLSAPFDNGMPATAAVSPDDTPPKWSEKVLPAALAIVEGQLTTNEWLLGAEVGLVDCAYCPVLNVIERAGFNLAGFPKVDAHLGACRARPAWQETPKLPVL
jgi:glutathione S-transferase